MAANVAAGSDSNPDFKSAFQGGSSVNYFDKKIQFVPARKPFNGLPRGGGDFKIETLNTGGHDQSRHGSVQAAANGKVKKGDGSETFDGWLDPELSVSVSFPRIGAGLVNLGNTCFLNSVLQCLTYTEPLAAYLQSGKHQTSCRINGFCALCAIQKHVSLTLKATGRILAPKDLVANLRCVSRNFRTSRQEDAHEYMVNLLESMHKCCLPSGVPSESAGAYEKSLVHKIFGGRLRSQVKCLQCNNCSDKFDPFLDLSLEIDRAESLQKAIKHFTAPEPLDGGERQYQCEKCKQKVKALKQLTIHKAPYVLTIHLKRFHSHNPGEKINKNVSFETTLDLKQFVTGSYEGDLKYSLYGVLVHHGWNTHSGHYYCYVRTSTNMWYSLDDNEVRQVSESSVLKQKAYMLFYVRNRNSAPRKRVEITHKERVQENNQNLNMVSSFAFSKSPSCTVQASQVADKSCVKVTSSSSVITKEAISVSSVKQVLKPDSKDSRNMVSTPNTNVENKTVDSDASGESSKESTVTDGLRYTSDRKEDMHEMAKVPSGNMSDKNDSANTSSRESSQEGDAIASLVDKSLGLVHGESHTLTASSTLSSGSSQVGTVDSKTSKKHKKHMKHKLASVNFGPSLLLRVSLGPRKKLMIKKHRVKKDRTACDSGPSTSDITDSVVSVQRRKVKSSKKKIKNKGAKTEERATKGTSFKDSETAYTKAIESVKVCKNDNMENGLLSIVKRGLEETLVAQWEDITPPPSPSIESPNANAGNAIGYVPDEWDEEYDRGKRKKVRQSKLQFGGPNHFQEIASRHIQSKKAKFDRAFAGNHPLRI